MLSRVEHEKSFITSGPAFRLMCQLEKNEKYFCIEIMSAV